MQTLLIHEAFVEPSMLSHIESLIARIYHKRVIQQIVLFQIGKQPSYVVIQTTGNLGVVTHITLKLVFRKCLT